MNENKCDCECKWGEKIDYNGKILSEGIDRLYELMINKRVLVKLFDSDEGDLKSKMILIKKIKDMDQEANLIVEISSSIMGTQLPKLESFIEERRKMRLSDNNKEEVDNIYG